MKAQPFGRYLLLDKVASGGMAEVWRAKLGGEAGFQRIVAIKKILPHVCEDQEFITMFQDEAKITVQLQHANIGQVYEFDKLDGIYFIGMEYISSKDLKTIWSYQRSRKSTMPIDLACFCVQKMADGLDYAHRKKDNFGNDLGIVHRDVSPQNCLVSWDGEVKIIDFGIAKAADKAGHTRAGTLKGKFAYMSPEQIRGLPLDGRADIFALGICLYELVTGERGFQAESEFSLLEMVRNVEIKPPTMVNGDIPQELERIIFKALAKDRDDRYRWASDLSEDLQRFLLNKGKPPNRHSMGQFLRENFTVDYDKERLRLESYKEINFEPAPPPVAAVAAAPAAPPPASLTAVQAALAADAAGGDAFSTNNESGAFAPIGTGTHTNAAPNGNGNLTNTGYSMGPSVEQTAATRTGFAPAMPRPALKEEAAAPAKRSLGPMIGIAAAALVVVIGVVVAAVVLFGGKSGSVTVNVTGPADAMVRLDGVDKGTANPSLFIGDVAAGQHEIIVEKAGYQLWTMAIDVEAGKRVPLNATLERQQGRFQLNTKPAGAAIFLNGEDTGKVTPAIIGAEGAVPHAIIMKAKGFHDLVLNETVEPAKLKEIDGRMKPQVLKLKIVSVPSGAKLKLSGSRSTFTTPHTLEWDPELPYPQIKLTRKGCDPLETTMSNYEKDIPEQQVAFTLNCK